MNGNLLCNLMSNVIIIFNISMEVIIECRSCDQEYRPVGLLVVNSASSRYCEMRHSKERRHPEVNHLFKTYKLRTSQTSPSILTDTSCQISNF